MITLDVAYQEPQMPEYIKYEKYMNYEEWWNYRNTHKEITNKEDCLKYNFDTLLYYKPSVIYVDSQKQVWRKETEVEYVLRTGDLWG